MPFPWLMSLLIVAKLRRRSTWSWTARLSSMARQGLDQSRPNKVLLVSSMIGERLQKLNDRIEGRSGPAMVFGENIEYTNLLRNCIAKWASNCRMDLGS